ncbi:MAG: thiamine phosphate synthase [Candidatus Bipolaricaulota bacterium]|nr:thiamine phosphate synthase [Candidatus Bipolaricaulota bacterium]MDW8031873.1 thiamine phosphate synthase [Candidatus Bipolaricaulota bacterium]
MRLHGLYLIVDLGVENVLARVAQALEGGVDVLQLWGSAPNRADVGHELSKLAKRFSIPLLVQDDLELAKKLGADGVHLDRPEITPQHVRRALGKDAVVGVTCSANFEKVLWAAEQGADYISFCSIFPSPSVAVCDLVPLEVVRRATETVTIPIFAAGGITLDNAHLVLEAGVDGLAVSSSILRAPDPKEAARRFQDVLRRYRTPHVVP